MLPVVRAVIEERNRRQENLRLRRQRQVFRKTQAFHLPERRFVELFRLSKDLARVLIELLRPHIPETISNWAISLETMVLCSLRFYATGSYQRCLGEECNLGMAQSTVHKYVHLITNLIDEHVVHQQITFPATERERDEIKLEFLHRWGFPGVVGAVDGSHIAILKPTAGEHNYINRKGYHSINTQIICDHNLKIRNIFANYGGASHDSFIWRNSQINDYIRIINQNERCWLIGDSGYPLLPYLMTPFRDPANEAEHRYNNAHIMARNCIERCIGVLKMRFRCLLKERTARYGPEFVCKLIKVCAALHNMCIDWNVGIENIFREDPNDDIIEEHGIAGNANEGQEIRQFIVNNYFLR